MAEYNRWMNVRLYDAAARLSEVQLFEDRGAFFGSLFDTLNHIAVADTIWLHRFSQHPDLSWLKDLMAGFPRPSSLRQRLAQSLPDLRAYREKADDVISAFAARITEAQLEASLRYANTSGQAQVRSFGGLVQHFFNHQTHHRGQATTLLFQAGVDVGVTDLLSIIPSEA
ncbi:MAG: DinB family protein [Azoarcus sp.]|nr:DinB family protein [Azoarcus sp.]